MTMFYRGINLATRNSPAFTGAATFDSNVSLSSASPTLQVGTNSGSPTLLFEKTNTGISEIRFHSSGLGESLGAKSIEYDDGEVLNLRHHTGGGWLDMISIGNTGGGSLGFFGATSVPQPAAYTPTNVTPARAFDADTVLVAGLADVVGTMIADLQAYGLFL